eukprot:1156994-Pelagomonas_calceolata.AAC.6
MPISTSPATLEPADLTQGSPRPPPSSASQMPSTSPDLRSAAQCGGMLHAQYSTIVHSIHAPSAPSCHLHALHVTRPAAHSVTHGWMEGWRDGGGLRDEAQVRNEPQQKRSRLYPPARCPAPH